MFQNLSYQGMFLNYKVSTPWERNLYKKCNCCTLDYDYNFILGIHKLFLKRLYLLVKKYHYSMQCNFFHRVLIKALQFKVCRLAPAHYANKSGQ